MPICQVIWKNKGLPGGNVSFWEVDDDTLSTINELVNQGEKRNAIMYCVEMGHPPTMAYGEMLVSQPTKVDVFIEG